MEEEQLIEETGSELVELLERATLPEIETPGHKSKLKEVLLNRYFPEKRRWEILNIFQKFVPAVAIIILLIFLIFNNLILPNYNLTKAKEIALNDPQIKSWVTKGAIIKDVKVIQNKGYVLVQPEKITEEIPTEKAPILEETKKEEFNGALIQINLKKDEVNKIEKLSPQITPLSEKEKEMAKEIAEKNSQIQEVIKKEAKIGEINPLPSQELKLMKEKDSVKVVPEEKKVQIIYKFDNSLLKGEVDLIKEQVGNVQLQEGIKE